MYNGTQNQEPEGQQPSLTIEALRKARALLGPIPKRPSGIMSYFQFNPDLLDWTDDFARDDLARAEALDKVHQMGTDE